MNSCITLVSHRFIENQSLGLNESITPSVTTALILDLDMDGWMEMGMKRWIWRVGWKWE